MVVQSVCVYLSSSDGTPAFIAGIQALGQGLARRGLTLVYGGAHRGLMGVLADSVIAAGGRTVGVIPRALVDLEVAHTGLTELHVVETMHQRKWKMFELADAFVVGPGGFGTYEEAFEILTGIQLGYHRKPIVFLDLEGFWSQMVGFLDHAVVTGVLAEGTRGMFRTAPDAAVAIDLITAES